MNTSFNQGSAKIYQFPVGGRSALGGRRHDEVKTAVDLASSRVSEAVVGRRLVSRSGHPGIQAATGA